MNTAKTMDATVVSGLVLALQVFTFSAFAEGLGGRLDDLVEKARQCVPLSERREWNAHTTLDGCLKLVEIYESGGDKSVFDAVVATGWDIACEDGYIVDAETNEKWQRLCRKLREITGDTRWDEQLPKAEYRLAGSSPRLDRSKFIVGTYGLGNIKKIEEWHVRDLAACGIDLVSVGGSAVSIESSGKRRDEILGWCLGF